MRGRGWCGLPAVGIGGDGMEWGAAPTRTRSDFGWREEKVGVVIGGGRALGACVAPVTATRVGLLREDLLPQRPERPRATVNAAPHARTTHSRREGATRRPQETGQPHPNFLTPCSRLHHWTSPHVVVHGAHGGPERAGDVHGHFWCGVGWRRKGARRGGPRKMVRMLRRVDWTESLGKLDAKLGSYEWLRNR